MRVVIISGGDYSYNGEINDGDYVICADSGYDAALKRGIKVNLLMGDMDSINADISGEQENLIFPVRKDFTDTELAVRHAVDMKPDEIILLGCMGSRADHTLANIFLLKYISEKGIIAHIEDENNNIYYYNGFISFDGMAGKTVSLIPVTSEIGGITTSGMDYPLKDGILCFGESRGVSNVITEDYACYSSEYGEGIVVLSSGI